MFFYIPILTVNMTALKNKQQDKGDRRKLGTFGRIDD